MTLDGETLTERGDRRPAGRDRRLVLLRGRWVEVDRDAPRAHDGAVPRGRGPGRGARAELRRGDAACSRAPAIDRTPRTTADAQTGPGDRRAVAGGDVARLARAGRSGADPGPALHGTLRPYQQAGVHGCTCCPASAWARAWPTTWASARPSRSWPCCCCSAASGAAEPAGGAGLAARQLGGGDRSASRPSLRARIVHPSAMPAERRSSGSRRTRRRPRPGHHQLRLAAAAAGADGSRLAPRHPRRGAGDQEPRRQADPGGQGAEGAVPDRADRHAGREPPRRSVVDLRLHQSRPAGLGAAVHAATRRGSPNASATRTARCASWCGPTSCGA